MSLKFKASTEVPLLSPERVMNRLCDYFREFGDVSIRGECRRIETAFGVADLQACEACLKIWASGKDETALAYVKLALAEHLLNFAEDEPVIVWQGDGAAGQPLPYFREMRVVRNVPLTPRMRRLTLSGEKLERFASGGMHVRLLIPKEQGKEPGWPAMGADGRPSWPDDAGRPDVRIYTIRRLDLSRGELDIDFVLHDGETTPGARFAMQASLGDVVGMTGPGGGAAPSADWYLLAGDETALPAIARILEQLPMTAHAVVRIEVADQAEIQPLKSPATLDLGWLCRDGAEAGTAKLLPQAVRAVEMPADGRSRFVWAGCEYGDFLDIRRYVRATCRMAREEHLIVAYWRRGAAGDDARKSEG